MPALLKSCFYGGTNGIQGVLGGASFYGGVNKIKGGFGGGSFYGGAKKIQGGGWHLGGHYALILLIETKLCIPPSVL